MAVSSHDMGMMKHENIICHLDDFNTYNAAGVSRRQDQNVTNLVKNVNIMEFGYYIWNPYEKCIQKSPNMPGIGPLIREIDVTISENWETNILLFAQ